MSKQVTDIEYMDTLCTAASNGNMEIVTLLLDSGHINTSSFLYRAAFQCASSKGHTRIVKLFCKHGTKQQFIYTNAMLAASFTGHNDIVELLMD